MEAYIYYSELIKDFVKAIFFHLAHLPPPHPQIFEVAEQLTVLSQSL